MLSEFDTTDYTDHPVPDALTVDETLPRRDEVLDLAGSAVFVPVCYQTMDMAMMPGGPMLIEINGVGGFALPQLASGRGFLTSEVLEFFAEWGVRLRGRRS